MCPYQGHHFLYTMDRIIFDNRKHEYEVMRMQTFYLLQPHLDLKKGNVTRPSDLMSFQWDAESIKKIELDPENFTEDSFAALDNLYNK